MAMDEPSHMRVHPQCGACGRPFKAGTNIVALTYHHDVCVALNAGSYSDDGYCEQVNYDYLFCQFPDCRDCKLRNESITCHTDCFNLVRHSSGVLRKLWIAATWRHPWQHSLPLLLPSRPEDSIQRCISLASLISKLPRLKDLPNEIAMVVIQFSGPHLLWRYSSVIELMRELDSAEDSTQTIPLINIGSWDRGSQPILSPSRTGIIQLTIDDRGLKQICRMEKYPEYRRSSQFLYITREATQLSGIEAHFNIGLGRLSVPETLSLQLWDSPALPRFCFIQPLQQQSASHISRFTTIDLKECYGLTFFILRNGVYSIHSHTSTSPSASETFDTFTPDLQAVVTWFYLPLVNEEIVSLGLRFQVHGRLYIWPCFLIHLRSGNYVIGPHYTGQVIDITVPVQGQAILAYELPKDPYISTIGVSSTSKITHHSHTLQPNEPPFQPAFFSSATLRGVTSITIFRDQRFSFCRGMIFTYIDNTRRILGQCRVGEDTSTVYEAPTALYYTSIEYNLEGIKLPLAAVNVEIATSTDQEPEKDENKQWVFSLMNGVMNFWFNAEQSALKIKESGENNA